MKKILFLIICLIPILCVAQIDSYKNKNRAFITSQDFIKDKLIHPKEAKFNNNVVHETDGEGKCIIIGKVSTTNSFGVKTEYSYKIWLTHNGKDWTNKTNWNYSKLILENTTTGKQEVFDNRIKPKTDKSKKEPVKIDGVECIVFEYNSSFTNITTSKKLSENQIKKAIETMNINTNLVYFFLPSKTNRGEEYAFKNKDLILIYE